jgi:predicted nucleic acid-binding protein
VPFVLDASIAACWVYPDEQDARADAAYERLFAKDRALAPLHWWFELRNVLLIGERRKRAPEQRTADFLKRISHLPIELAELPPAPPVFLLARKHRLSFYDAAYLELAQRESIPLATLDDALGRAAVAERVPLLGVE